MTEQELTDSVATSTEITMPREFKKEWLAKYGVIWGPGKYLLTCARNVTKRDLVLEEPSGRNSYIMSFRAIPSENYEALKAIFRDRDVVRMEEVAKQFLHGVVYQDENGLGLTLPMKGEKVETIVDWVEIDGARILQPIAFRIKPAVELVLIDVTKDLGPTPFEKAEIVREALNEVTLQHH